MELDDLKNDWDKLSTQTSKQNILTSQAINQMTQTKYHSKINKIMYPELIGGLICLIAIVFIGIEFSKLDTIFLQSIGILTMVLLFVLPLLSFLSLKNLVSTHHLNRPHIEILKQFANHKLQFQKYQKTNALLCYLLLVATVILLPKFSYGKDITINKEFWIFAFSFGYIFLVIFSKCVKRFYSKSLNQAEELIKDINDATTTSE